MLDMVLLHSPFCEVVFNELWKEWLTFLQVTHLESFPVTLSTRTFVWEDEHA